MVEYDSRWAAKPAPAANHIRGARKPYLVAIAVVASIAASAVQAATITVTTLDDELNADGDCSLREAVQAFNTGAAVDACAAGTGTDTITFDPALAGQTIVLDLAGAEESANLSGDLDIDRSASATLIIAGPTLGDDQSIIIDGNATGSTLTGLNCSSADRVLHVPSGSLLTSLELTDLTLQHGCVEQMGTEGGAGLLVEPSGVFLELNNARVVQNQINNTGSGAPARGAGISTAGPFTITGSTISENRLEGPPARGAGFYFSGAAPVPVTYSITGSTFADNLAFRDGDVEGVGAHIDVSSGTGATLNIIGTAFTGNQGDRLNFGNTPPQAMSGGGLWVSGASQLTIQDSLIENNSFTDAIDMVFGVGAYVAMANPANLSIANSSFAGNTSLNGGGGGGGLYVTAGAGTITANRSRFVDNNLTTTFSGSGFEGRVVGGGARIEVQLGNGELHTLSILNSEFSGNTAAGNGMSGDALGGGLFLISRCQATCGAHTVELRNTTISGNQASAPNQGFAAGGGLFLTEDLSASAGVTLNNVTIADNAVIADNSGGFGGGGGLASNGVTVSVGNSIIATNTEMGGGAGPDCYDFPPSLTIASTGFDLIGDATGCSFVSVASDQLGTTATPIDPLLMALGDNGSPTRTHALLPGSPAIDAGNPAAVDSGPGSCETTDQRGETRPQDGDGDATATCDIGAFELVPNESPTVIAPIPDQMLTLGDPNFSIDLTTVFADPEMQPLVFSATSSNPGVANASVSGNILTVAPSTAGATDITVTAMDSSAAMTSDIFTVTITAANQPPTVANPIPDQNLVAGDPPVNINLTAVFTDANGDTLSFTAASSNTSVATVNVSGNTLTITPLAAGSATVTVTATDPDGAGAVDNLAVAAATANLPPVVVNPIPDQTVAADDAPVTLNLNAVFNDPDGDALAFAALSSNAAVATATVSGALLTITPLAQGNASVTVTATDPDEAGVADNATVIVTPGNQPPTVINPIPNQSLRANAQPVTFDLATVFSDPEVGSLTFTATSSDPAVATAMIDGNTLTIAPLAIGSATITVVATDPASAATSVMPTVQVQMENRQPSVEAPILDVELKVGAEKTIDLTTVFTDPDGDPLTFTAISTNPNVVAVTVSGNPAILTITALAPGNATITITAQDSFGASRIARTTVSDASSSLSPSGGGGCTLRAVGAGTGDPLLWLLVLLAWGWRGLQRTRRGNSG